MCGNEGKPGVKGDVSFWHEKLDRSDRLRKVTLNSLEFFFKQKIYVCTYMYVCMRVYEGREREK